MNKFFSFFQFAYLIFGAVFIVTGILEYGKSPQRAFLMFGMAALAIFMFFFKRHFKRKFDNKK